MNEQELLKALGDKEHTEHLDELTIAQFIDNTLSPEQREEVLDHIADCKECRDLVMETQRELKETQSTSIQPANNSNNKIFMPLLAIASTFMIITFIPFEDDTIIYKGNSDIINLELPKLEYNTTSSCSDAQIKEAQKYLEISYDIEDVDSYEYYKSLVDSMSACYSPEVATQVYIIKAQNSKDDEQMLLLKEALNHSALIRTIPIDKMKFKLKKELFILKLLKPHFSGDNRKDIENRIKMKERILNEISN
jgi:hypothetical protein